MLGVVMCCKNEAHILLEWLAHYRKEGATRFYVTDNGSTDGSVAILRAQPDVDLIEDSTPHAQVRLLQHMCHTRVTTAWVACVDADEFMYATGPGDTLAAVVARQADTTAVIQVPWLLFGSSGHVAQPSSVIDGFCRRSQHRLPAGTAATQSTPTGWEKMLFRIGAARLVDSVHVAVPPPGHAVVDDHLQPLPPGTFARQTPERAQSCVVALNHYIVQSLDFFTAVKMTRGDSASAAKDKGWRTLAYFRAHDTNEVEDTRLRDKRRS